MQLHWLLHVSGVDSGGGGGGDPGGHRTYSDFIQAWRIEKHESGSSFLLGGEVSEEVETLGEASPLPTSFK